MIVSVEELRLFVSTDEIDKVLEYRIQALESFICQYTNNEFKSRITGEKEYPIDVKMGAINVLKWQFRNDEKNSGDTSKQDVSSETISRHSVTYAKDESEFDIDVFTGVPKKLCAFLKPYMKARF